MPKKLSILPGDKFGRYTIVKEVERRGQARFFLCRCDCGTEKDVRMVMLTNGHTKSCGCLKREHLISMTSSHGWSRTALYSVWTAMKQRCLNNQSRAFPGYGGRGILITDEWLNFENFRDWAIINGYKEGLTIERKDNNGNYEPHNCKWIPQSQQSSNTRNTIFVEHNGEKEVLKTRAEKLGLNPKTVYGRLHRGWSLEKALNEPIDTRMRRRQSHGH